MLRDYDEAVAVQAAALLYEKGSDPFAEELTNALRRAAPHVQAGFKLFSDQLERPGEH